MQSCSSQLYHWLWTSSRKSCLAFFLSLQLMLEGKTMALFYKKLHGISLIGVFAMKRLRVLSLILRRDFFRSGEDSHLDVVSFVCDMHC